MKDESEEKLKDPSSNDDNDNKSEWDVKNKNIISKGWLKGFSIKIYSR